VGKANCISSLEYCQQCCSAVPDYCALPQHYNQKPTHLVSEERPDSPHTLLLALAPSSAKVRAVLEFLTSLDLEQYFSLLVNNGFNTLQSLRNLDAEILDVLRITKVGHCVMLVNAVDK
jgi:hypothetical protein